MERSTREPSPPQPPLPQGLSIHRISAEEFPPLATLTPPAPSPTRGEGELDQTKYEHPLPSPLVGEGPGVRVAGEGAGFRRCDECSATRGEGESRNSRKRSSTARTSRSTSVAEKRTKRTPVSSRARCRCASTSARPRCTPPSTSTTSRWSEQKKSTTKRPIFCWRRHLVRWKRRSRSSSQSSASESVSFARHILARWVITRMLRGNNGADQSPAQTRGAMSLHSPSPLVGEGASLCSARSAGGVRD